MKFKTKRKADRKIFTVEFPYEVIFQLQWSDLEQEQLQEYEESKKVSDKLRMMTLIADKIERRTDE